MEKSIEGLRADLSESPTTQNRCVGPTTDTERVLAEVLADVVGIEQVSVDSHFFTELGADSLVMARFCARVRKRADLPSVSMKDIYQYPTIRSLVTALADAAPAPTGKSIERLTSDMTTDIEKGFAEVLADVVGVEHVSVNSHFFTDLGADSLVMARFCARIRKRADLPPVSMKDIYEHSTIRSLATALADAAPAPVESPVPASIEVVEQASTLQYVMCGVLQFLLFLGYAYLSALVISLGYDWISAGSGLIEIYLRSVLFSGAVFLAMCTLPILAKWILIGRWKPQQIRIWSLAYLRFWLVKALIRSNPLALLFGGSPLFTLYLRMLGAKVGRGVLILSKHVPVCTDLITIGDGAVIRKESFFSCYRAQAGMIQTGAVTLGKNVLVGEATVLDIETSMGDGAKLGHSSSLHTGQAVPDGEYWHGSPAEPAEVNFPAVDPAKCGSLRGVVFTVLRLLLLLFLYLPLTVGGVAILITMFPRLYALLFSGPMAFTNWTFYCVDLVVSCVLFFGGVLVALIFMSTVPRVLNLFIKPDKVYPLYGFHYTLYRAIERITNSKFFVHICGDSSFIVHYLRFLGYNLSPVVQTGSNFGNEVKHDNPFLCSVGSGTVIASGLTIVNADYSNTSFRVSRVSIGPHNFFGNAITYPSQGRMGDNCLLASKVLVPVDGKLREGVGLLGSPSFEIPRTVERDNRFAHLASGDEQRRRLVAKNMHNAITIGLYLLSKWFYVSVLTLVLLFMELSSFNVLVITLAEVFILAFSLLYVVFIERACTGFRPLQPEYCSIYEINFWRRERHFKMEVQNWVPAVFGGTPFASVIWRLLGVRLGKRLFDDGCGMDEKNLVTIGDDVTLNVHTVIQCHSQEDFTFKSQRVTIGSGCTLGVGALVHYGVTMGDGVVLAPDSFLMKGSEVPSHESWGGNPARVMPEISLTNLQVRQRLGGPTVRMVEEKPGLGDSGDQAGQPAGLLKQKQQSRRRAKRQQLTPRQR